jgi:hypothetical protein
MLTSDMEQDLGLVITGMGVLPVLTLDFVTFCAE